MIIKRQYILLIDCQRFFVLTRFVNLLDFDGIHHKVGLIMNNVNVRNMVTEDLEEVIKVHKTAFPGFFLTRMGTKIIRLYYETLINYDGTIALVACQQHNKSLIEGFVTGFSNPRGFYSVFNRKRREMALSIIIALLKDPKLITDIWRNAYRIQSLTLQDSSEVELSSIAARKTGVGTGGLLIKSFIDIASKQGATHIRLSTDAENNDFVRKFYESKGFQVGYFENRGKRRMCHYVLQIL